MRKLVFVVIGLGVGVTVALYMSAQQQLDSKQSGTGGTGAG